MTSSNIISHKPKPHIKIFNPLSVKAYLKFAIFGLSHFPIKNIYTLALKGLTNPYKIAINKIADNF